MKKLLALSALTFALALSACGTITGTPDPSTARPLPATVTLTPAPFELSTDAAVLEHSGLSVQLDGRMLVLKPGALPINVQFVLPDGTATFPEALTHEIHREASLGLVVKVGQAFLEPAVTVALKPRAAAGTGTVTPAQ